MLDPESIRIAIALRLGLPLCTPHPCRCGLEIDAYGLHPLSCKMSTGRFPRHAALNDIVRRALTSAGFPSSLEPSGLDRGDGKRPDGITLFPFKHGKPLIWDATCCDSFAPSNMLKSATDPSSAARNAEALKVAKYSALTDRYIFEPVAVETSGAIGPSSMAFLKLLGSKLSDSTRDRRETEWLMQRISLAIVRGNSTAISTASRHLM